MVHFWARVFFKWQLACNFGTVDRIFFIDFLSWCVCTLPKYCLLFFLYIILLWKKKFLYQVLCNAIFHRRSLDTFFFITDAYTITSTIFSSMSLRLEPRMNHLPLYDGQLLGPCFLNDNWRVMLVQWIGFCYRFLLLECLYITIVLPVIFPLHIFTLKKHIFISGTVDRILLSISSLRVFVHYHSIACYFSSTYFYSEKTYFHIKYFAMPYSIDAVSTLFYYGCIYNYIHYIIFHAIIHPYSFILFNRCYYLSMSKLVYRMFLIKRGQGLNVNYL